MIDVSKIVGDIKGEGNPPAEPDGDEEPAAGGEDHKAKIQAAMTKVQDGLAELQKCIDEY